jgi:hypothetical protein
MDEQEIGWIAAIIIAGIAGWLAEQFIKSQMGLVMHYSRRMLGGWSGYPDERSSEYEGRRLMMTLRCYMSTRRPNI